MSVSVVAVAGMYEVGFSVPKLVMDQGMHCLTRQSWSCAAELPDNILQSIWKGWGLCNSRAECEKCPTLATASKTEARILTGRVNAI